MTTHTNPVTTAGIAENRLLGLLSDYGLPQPDRIEEDGVELVFIWTEQKVMIRIDLPGLPDDDPTTAIS
jgi:hypothetical protein